MGLKDAQNYFTNVRDAMKVLIQLTTLKTAILSEYRNNVFALVLSSSGLLLLFFFLIEIVFK